MGAIEIVKKIATLQVLRQLNQNDVTVSLIPVINHCFNLSGQKVKTEDVKFICEQLSKILFDRYQSLTMDEVYLSLKNGMQKEYGEYYGLNALTFAGFIKSYNESEERLRIKEAKIRQQHLLEAPRELTSEQKEQIVIDGIFEKFEDYKKKGQVQDLGNIAYNYLGTKGLLKFTKEYKDSIKMRAEMQIRNDASNKILNSFDPFERNYLKEIIEYPCKKVGADLQIMCKNIALNDFFKKLIDEGIELNSILNTSSKTTINEIQLQQCPV